MSIGGPSGLGTLLVQRLDAALGTTLSQQANVVSGARPDAVTQPGQPERPEAVRNELLRDTRSNVDRVLDQSKQQGNQHAVDRGKFDARAAALLAGRGLITTTAIPSAPTSLGQAARAILALLANYPDLSAAIQGKTPLLNHRPGQIVTPPNAVNTGTNPRTDISNNTTARATTSTPTPGATGGGTATATTAVGSSVIPSAGIAGQLIQILTQTVQNSGMFYEAHLNQLTFGKQTLAQLQQEPQAQAGRTANTPQDAGNANLAATAKNAASSATEGSASSRAQNASTGNNPAAAQTNIAPVPGIDPQTHLLVRQQLEVLANQTFAWRGEVWPDAPMEWQVSRHEHPADEQNDTEPSTHWATKIAIQLPQLGHVDVRITLSGQQLLMHVVAPTSSALLSEHTEVLRDRCQGQGLQLSQLSIVGAEPDAAATKETHDDDPASRAE